MTKSKEPRGLGTRGPTTGPEDQRTKGPEDQGTRGPRAHRAGEGRGSTLLRRWKFFLVDPFDIFVWSLKNYLFDALNIFLKPMPMSQNSCPNIRMFDTGIEVHSPPSYTMMKCLWRLPSERLVCELDYRGLCQVVHKKRHLDTSVLQVSAASRWKNSTRACK